MQRMSVISALQHRPKTYSNAVLGMLLTTFVCLLAGGAMLTWDALTNLLLAAN